MRRRVSPKPDEAHAREKLAALGTRRNVRVEQKPQDLLRCFVHRSGSISLPNQERIGGRLDLVSKSIAIDTTHQISLDGDTALDPSGGPGRLSGRIVPCVGERENSLSQAAAIGFQKDCENLKMVARSVGDAGQSAIGRLHDTDMCHARCCGSFRSCGVDHERTLKPYFLRENAAIVSLGFYLGASAHRRCARSPHRDAIVVATRQSLMFTFESPENRV